MSYNMFMIGVLTILAIAKTVLSSSTLKFSLDQPGLCQKTNVVARWLQENDVVMVHAKTGDDGTSKRFFNECVLKLGPKAESRKKTVKIKIESYYNGDCGVYLAVQQSPVSFFNEQVSTMFNLSCHSIVAHNLVYYADKDNNVQIFLQKRQKDALNYNFILNVTLVDHHEEEPGLSLAIIICIIVIIAIAVFGTACIIVRCLKIKNWTKRQYESDVGYSPRNLAQDSPTSTRYSNLPMGDNPPSHISQACIVGSEGEDGLCTVCHRHHDDFAHIVDVGPDGEVMETINSRHSHHRHDGVLLVNRDGALHVMDSNHSTPHGGAGGQFGRRRNDQSHSGSASRLQPPNRQSIPINHLSSSGEIMLDEDEDDDDIDVSGNDLIPPSYDLSPPSYDEALNMPKPDSDVHPSLSPGQQLQQQQLDVSETDPLYQNIDSLTHDNR
ncbi:hypothetical protein ACF0H5_014275 [Mactra antiquata]